MKSNRKLKMGMVGGGPDAFIGDVHRQAARMDGGIELVAGVFSSDPMKSKQTGTELNLDPDRVYDSYKEMANGERMLPEKERIDFVVVVTPNNLHFPIARDFLQAGFHVVCDKPMTLNLDEAMQLKKIVSETGKLFALTHNYTGYPMVKLARDMIRQGDLGNLRKIVVQYPQGWLSTPLEQSGQKQASWRTDPKQSGAGALGDIGTHCENLAEYITGLQITEVCADVTSFVENRKIDDDVNCLLRFENGAKGILHASQISVGEENNLAIWVYGDKKSLGWHQEQPNELIVRSLDEPKQVWRTGNPYVSDKSPAAARATRLPPGHPEGFIEAFANIYKNFSDTLRADLNNESPDPLALDFPTVDDGLRGMAFLETVLASAKSDRKWLPMKE